MTVGSVDVLVPALVKETDLGFVENPERKHYKELLTRLELLYRIHEIKKEYVVGAHLL